jgi:hypothetical protein
MEFYSDNTEVLISGWNILYVEYYVPLIIDAKCPVVHW